MTVSHAHARNACAHEQSTNIESGAVQWHKQSEQLLDCEREFECESEREKVYDFFAQNRPFATSNVQCAPDGWMFRQAQHDR